MQKHNQFSNACLEYNTYYKIRQPYFLLQTKGPIPLLVYNIHKHTMALEPSCDNCCCFAVLVLSRFLLWRAHTVLTNMSTFDIQRPTGKNSGQTHGQTHTQVYTIIIPHCALTVSVIMILLFLSLFFTSV